MSDALTAVVDQSAAAIGSLEIDLKGTGENAWQAFRALRQVTTSLPSVGETAAASIARIRQGQDGSLPPEGVSLEAHRSTQVSQVHGDASTIIEKMRQASYAAADQLENALHDSIIPVPARDPGERMLRRDELKSVLLGAKGAALVQKMLNTIGMNSAYDAELLGDAGRALLAADGMGDEWNNFKRAAVSKLALQPGGTERQQAAKAALNAFHQRNVRGRISAFHQAAKQRLS